MKRFLVKTAVAVVLGLSTVTPALAELVFEHVGNADPFNEGWFPAGELSPSPDDGPPPNWRVTGGGGYYGRGGFDASLTDPTGWTLTMTAKLTTASSAYRAVVNITDATNRLQMHMIDGAGVLEAGMYYADSTGELNEGSKLGTVDPTDGFHTYQMIMNPNGAGTGDDQISFYVDGALATTKLRADLYGFGGAADNYFGHGTAPGPNDSQYALLRLETGQHPILSLVGDLNSDGFVGQDDLNLVLASWGQTVEADDPADPNGDLFVGQDDLNPVLGNWGQGTPPGELSAVPEPQTLVLAGLAGFAALALFRNRRKPTCLTHP